MLSDLAQNLRGHNHHHWGGRLPNHHDNGDVNDKAMVDYSAFTVFHTRFSDNEADANCVSCMAFSFSCTAICCRAPLHILFPCGM